MYFKLMTQTSETCRLCVVVLMQHLLVSVFNSYHFHSINKKIRSYKRQGENTLTFMVVTSHEPFLPQRIYFKLPQLNIVKQFGNLSVPFAVIRSSG